MQYIKDRRTCGFIHGPPTSVFILIQLLLFMLFYFYTGKLLSRSYRIAYALLHKVGSPKDGTSIMLEDRVC